jgi:hypothetical protein
MSGNDNNPIARGEHVIAMLSEYIDGALDAAELDSVRAHLEGCDACRAEHAELLATRAMLRAVPAMQAPRAFTLTPEMAHAVRPPSLFNRIFTPSNAPSMAMGSALTFVLLFFVLLFAAGTQVSITFSKIGYGMSGNGDYSAPAAKQQDTAVTMAAPPQAQATMTTGASVAGSAPEVQGLVPQGTPAPAAVPPNAGGGLPDTDSANTESAPAPDDAAGTTAAEAPDDTTMRGSDQADVPAARQTSPPSAPVDWGAALMSIAPMFLLALGLGLAVMAWIARRNRAV